MGAFLFLCQLFDSAEPRGRILAEGGQVTDDLKLLTSELCKVFGKSDDDVDQIIEFLTIAN